MWTRFLDREDLFIIGHSLNGVLILELEKRFEMRMKIRVMTSEGYIREF